MRLLFNRFMADFKQLIEDTLDILKIDGTVQNTLAEFQRKWGTQVRCCQRNDLMSSTFSI